MIKERVGKVMVQRTIHKSIRSSHHVCFSCCKHFHKPVEMLGEISKHGHFRSLGAVVGQPQYHCPACGQVMTPVGKNFRAPEKDEQEAWEVAKQLLDAGFSHDYVQGGVIYPTRIKDIPEFLAQWQQKSQGEKLLEQWEKKP